MSYRPNIKFAKGRRLTYRVKNQVAEGCGNRRIVDVTNFGPLIVRNENEISWRYLQAGYDRIEYTFNGDRKNMNMCRHDRNYVSSNSIMSYGRVRYRANTVYGWEIGEKISKDNAPRKLDRPILAYYSHPLMVQAIPVDMSVLATRKFDAYQRLRADVEVPHMNVVRSLIELRDTKQTGKSIGSFISWLDKSRGLCAGRSCREAAKLYLTYQFGIKPTLDDVTRFIKELRSDRIRFVGNPTKFRGKNGVLETNYTIRPSDASIMETLRLQDYAQWEVQGWIGSTGSSIIRTVGDSPVLPTGWANALKRISYSPIEGKIFARVKTAFSVSAFDTFLKKFAWSCPLAQTAWDLYPFTFLIDWFFDIGTLLARLEREMAVAIYRINLDQAWEGQQSTTELRGPILQCSNHFLQFPTYMGGSYPMFAYRKLNVMHVAGWQTDVRSLEYVRRVYVPPELWDLVPPIRRDLSAYQLSAGAALIIANTRARSRVDTSPRIPANTKVVDWDNILKDYNHHWKDF